MIKNNEASEIILQYWFTYFFNEINLDNWFFINKETPISKFDYFNYTILSEIIEYKLNEK